MVRGGRLSVRPGTDPDRVNAVGHPGRVARLGTLLALALACMPAPAAIAATAGGAPHALAADGSPLDLASVALGQTDRALVLTVTARSAIEPAQLAAGRGRLCATLAGTAGSARLCIERRAGAWVARRGARPVAATVTRPRAGRLEVRVAPAALGLAPGPLTWSVTATPASCGGAVAAQTGGVAPGDGAGTPPPATGGGGVPCGSRAPRQRGTYPGRVWRAVVTGCTAPGTGRVTGGRSRRLVALTYDDGPSRWTARFVDELARLGVPATFFLIGRQVSGEGALLRRMVDAGHELANHSWDHANLGGGGSAATSQLQRTSAAIRRVTGFSPCLFRPPYGSVGADLVARSQALGMRPVLWNVDPADWRAPGAGAIVANVLRNARGGSIILGHDGGGSRAQTLAALPQIVAGLRARGLEFTTVSGLLGGGERLALRR